MNLKGENPLSKWLKKITKRNQQTGEEGKNKSPSLYFYMLLILVLGIVAMIGSEFFTKTDSLQTATTDLPVFNQTAAEDVETFGSKKANPGNSIADYEQQYEEQIKEALESMSGVKEVTVVVNLEATELTVFEKNTVTQKQVTEETDREGGQRTVEDTSKDEQIVIYRNGEKEVPIVQQTKKPAVRGVLVVAKGADNITVKKWIIEAVTKTLDIPSHRVAVMPKK